MKINVGIVEDDREVRENLTKLLNLHARVKCMAAFANGEAALEGFNKLGQPDVVLMDINLPGMSGIQCAARLKERFPKTNILMLTAYSDNNHIFEALKVGAGGYLLKNTPTAELISSITAVIEGGAPMTGQIARRVIDAFRKPATDAVAESDLTPREIEILQLVARGYANKEIASHLGISPGTARNHIGHIYEKMHVRCRAEATAKYLGGSERPLK